MSNLPAVRARGLSRAFGDVRAIRDLSFELPRGRVTALLGANGAGKSTTLRAILGLLRLDAGELDVLGERVDTKPSTKVLGRIGALIEGPRLYGHRSGLENLELECLYRGRPRRRARELVQWAEVEAAAHREVATYSMGMRQRVALAAALVGEPELLLLDEPMTGLDPQGVRELGHVLRREVEQHGRTILLSSHRLPEVDQWADCFLVLREGELAFEGDREALVRLQTRSTDLRVADVAAALERLEAEGFEVGASPSGGPGWLELRASDDAAVARALRALVAGAVDVYEVRARESLESAFFELTAGEWETEGHS